MTTEQRPIERATDWLNGIILVSLGGLAVVLLLAAVTFVFQLVLWIVGAAPPPWKSMAAALGAQ